MGELLRTPLFSSYAGFPAVRCIDFSGWELPVQFYGIQQEHRAVREQAGLFDVSHMGELTVAGKGAEAFLQRMTTNDVSRLAAGQAQYTFMCNPAGGVVDDLLVYRLALERFLLVVNAANIEKVVAWLGKHAPRGIVDLQNRSMETALLALQGPKASTILSRVTEEPIDSLRPFRFRESVQVCGREALLSRTGYTGEDGFEMYVSAADAARVWSALLEAGRQDGLIPAGLGARDTLRLEAGLPLYGHELSETITPLEAGLDAFVKMSKAEGFIGRDALADRQRQGLARKRAGLEIAERGSIPRAGYPVFDSSGARVGEVTSGTLSPTLQRNIGLALIQANRAQEGNVLWVEIRGKRQKAAVVPVPFYKRKIKPAREGETRA